MLNAVVTTDGAPALIAAVEEAWPKSLRQRCVMHKTRNILDKVPSSAQPEIKQRLQAIWNAPNRATADLLLQDFIATYEPLDPSAVACLLDDLEASLVSCAVLPCITGAFAPPTCLSAPSLSNVAVPRPSRASWMNVVV